jgi:hypothetical protein
MAAAGTYPDAWKETCRITLIPDGASPIECSAATEDITAMDWGEKDIESMPLVNGGNVVKFTPFSIEGVTMKVYPITAGVNAETTATGFDQLFNKQATADSTQPIAVDNEITRQKFGVVMLWAETLPATATTLPAESKTARRVQVINAYMTTLKDSFDDKMLNAEMTLKWAPLDKDASPNRRVESTDGSSQLPAAITSATSW